MTPSSLGTDPGSDASPASAVPVQIVACVKWAELRPEIDPLHGTIEDRPRSFGISNSDYAAVETALRVADAWSQSGTECAVTVLTAAPQDSEVSLHGFFAAGVAQVVRLDLVGQRTSAQVAELLAAELSPSQLNAQVVICGDVSADRGSGSVPAFLAHQLGLQQALGLIGLSPTEFGTMQAVRRLDGGRRERLLVASPAVVSVEGSVADLRRASLAATLEAKSRTVEVLPQRPVSPAEQYRLRPWRPRPRVLAPPAGDDALTRILALTGAQGSSTSARTVHVDPEQAAEVVLEQLATWGYLDHVPPA
ncbi:MAG: mycofactocin-associated electron transfer flavoprotein beta subunit [Microthrixaceae bacterium]